MEPNITRFQCVVKLLARLKMLNEYTRGGQAIPASSPTARRFRMSRTGRTREIASFASYGRGDHWNGVGRVCNCVQQGTPPKRPRREIGIDEKKRCGDVSQREFHYIRTIYIRIY